MILDLWFRGKFHRSCWNEAKVHCLYQARRETQASQRKVSETVQIWRQKGVVFSPLAQVGPSHPGGQWHSKPEGTSWHVPLLAHGSDTQACSAVEHTHTCRYTNTSLYKRAGQNLGKVLKGSKCNRTFKPTWRGN
jgi:hypothetical protein